MFVLVDGEGTQQHVHGRQCRWGGLNRKERNRGARCSCGWCFSMCGAVWLKVGLWLQY